MLFGEEERKRARVAIPNYAAHRSRSCPHRVLLLLRRRRAVMDIKVAATAAAAEQHTYHMRIYDITHIANISEHVCVCLLALFCTLAASMLGRQMAYIGIRRCRSVEVPLQTPHRRHRTNISKLFRKSYFP